MRVYPSRLIGRTIFCQLPDGRTVHDASNLSDNFYANSHVSTLQSASYLLYLKVTPNS
jgi:hypothetical protein